VHRGDEDAEPAMGARGHWLEGLLASTATAMCLLPEESLIVLRSSWPSPPCGCGNGRCSPGGPSTPRPSERRPAIRGDKTGRLTMMDTMTASQLIGSNGVRGVESFELPRRTEVRDEHLRGGSPDRAPGGERPDRRHGEHSGTPGRPVPAPPRGDPTLAEPRARGAAQPMASEPSTLEIYLPTERAGWLWGWPGCLLVAVP